MKKILLSILYLLPFVSISLSAQVTSNKYVVVDGIIKDSSDNSLVAGANIKVNFGKLGIRTNDKGRFLIQLPLGASISITHLGYRPYRIRVDTQRDTLQLKVKLINIANELEEVVVSTQGSDKNISRPLIGVTQLSIKAIQKLPAAMGEIDVLRGLQMLPGVTSVGEASNGINIRGGTTDQNLILLDDTPIFNPTHLFGLFSIFPPDAISNIDLYKGSVPARLGGRTASVLDIQMTNPSLEKLKLTGGISLISNRLTLETPIVKEKLSILLSGRGSFNDFLFNLGPARLQNIRANFYDFATKVFYRANAKNTLTLSTYLSKDFFQTDLLGGIANINATATQFSYQTNNVALKWFHSFTPKVNLQTVVVYTDYQPKTLLPELNSDNKVTIESGIEYKQIKSSLIYVPTESHRLEAGISLVSYGIEPGKLVPGTSVSVNPITVPKENSLESAIYLEDEIMINKKLTVSIGLRYSNYWAIGPAKLRKYEQNSPKTDFTVTDSLTVKSGEIIKSYGGFEPRFALKYSLGALSSFKFGYNLMRQYIQVISNTTTPLPTSRWKASDDYIKPQISQLFSLGYFKNFKDNIYEISLEGYYRHTENVLDYKPGADFLFQPYLETQILAGKSKAYGVELMIVKKKGEFTGWVNYTYSRSLNQINEGLSFTEQINSGDWYATNYDRPHSFNGNFNLNPNIHHEFSFTLAYSTGRPFSLPVGFVNFKNVQYPLYEERNNERIKDYTRLDFSWTIRNPSMQKKRWEGSWTFTLYNLLGRSNAYSVYFRSEKAGIKPYQLTVFGSVIPSLTYNFKFL